MNNENEKYFEVSVRRAGAVIKEIEGIKITREGLKFWLFPAPSLFSKRQEVYVVYISSDARTVAYIVEPTEEELYDLLILDAWFSPEDNLIFTTRLEKANLISDILIRNLHVLRQKFPRRSV